MKSARFRAVPRVVSSARRCGSGAAADHRAPSPEVPAGWDFAPGDGGDAPETIVTEVAGEIGADVPGEDAPGIPDCAPGEGCFLDPCSENVDYQGGVGNGTTSNVGCGGGGGGIYGGGGGAGRSGAGGGGSGFLNETPPVGFSVIDGATEGVASTGGASQKSPPGTGEAAYGNQAGMSFNSGSYHGNPGRAVITIAGEQHVFGYTGAIQTFTANSP
ncbi:MAG: hypothetical protein ABIK09_12275 [Pseudomonadota bacterium]